MRISDQVRSLEEEITRLRDKLEAEQDVRRKWHGAINRAEDMLVREAYAYQARMEKADKAGDHTAKRIAEAGWTACRDALTHIGDARSGL